jgi:hypothetical protein
VPDAPIPDLLGADGRLSIDEMVWRAYQLGRAVERAIWRRRRRVVAR